MRRLHLGGFRRRWRRKCRPTSGAPSSIAGAAHALHDGYTDLIYIVLPLWQAEFGLTYAALGVLRGVFVGAMASLQIPAGFVSERFGAAGVSRSAPRSPGSVIALPAPRTGFAMLLGALFVGGIGASTQHPIASALVARAFAGPRSLKALGTYNFCRRSRQDDGAGDAVADVAGRWRGGRRWRILGSLGLSSGGGDLLCHAALRCATRDRPSRDAATTAAPQRTRHPFAFLLLLTIGIVDSATRMGFLLFLPFVLKDKGASLQTVGLAMTLVFAGGAAGKLACAFIGARIGAIATVWLTEGSTAAGILALLPLPLDAALVLLPVIGIALNGTSSVLYGSVPDLVAPQWRQPRAEHFLYRHDRLRRDRAGAVRPRRRRARDMDGTHAGRRLRAHHPADRGAVARRSGARIRFRGGVSASTLRRRNVAAFPNGGLPHPVPPSGTLDVQWRWFCGSGRCPVAPEPLCTWSTP